MTQFVRVRLKSDPKVQRVFTPAMAHALRDKYEVMTEQVEAASSEENQPQQESPNVQPAGTEQVKAADVNDGVELANARKEFEQIFGEKPHGRLQLKTILKLIEEKKGAPANEA